MRTWEQKKNLDNTEKEKFSFASILHIFVQIFSLSFFKVVPCVVKNKNFSFPLSASFFFKQHSEKLLCFIKIEKSFNIMRNYSRNLFIYKNLSLKCFFCDFIPPHLSKFYDITLNDMMGKFLRRNASRGRIFRKLIRYWNAMVII